MKDMRDTVLAINAEIKVKCEVKTDAEGNVYVDIKGDKAASMLNFKFNTESLVEAYATSNSDNMKIYLDQIGLQFNKLRDTANFLAQSSVELKAIQQRVEGLDGSGGILTEMENALKLIKETDVYKYNPELREILVADCENRIANVEQYIDEIVNGCKLYTEAGTGNDFLNSESDLYFMKSIQNTVNTYFEANFEENGVYETIYRNAKKKLDGVDVALEMAKIKRELLTACPTATISEEYIFAQIQGSEEVEEEDADASTATNNNRIVVVTYGDRDANTFVKTAYKSIILNYNSYAVRVTYENPLVDGDEPTLYTIPSGGYIVIEYN
jgi:hypothetical protein